LLFGYLDLLYSIPMVFGPDLDDLVGVSATVGFPTPAKRVLG